MITPTLFAQLGNQSFMVAAAIAHAKKMDTTFGVPVSTINPAIWKTYYTGLPICYWPPEFVYEEKSHSYAPLPSFKDLRINGYFQSEKYFIDHKKDIQYYLGFDLLHRQNNFCAIHVRRGDYLQYSDHFSVLGFDYYTAAISEMITAGYSNFKVYSDDIKFCKKTFLHKYFKGVEISFCENPHALSSMREMYGSQAFIIGNSTFSLFPALLRDDNPKVIAPAEHRWFGPKSTLDTKDLMPERFLKL